MMGGRDRELSWSEKNEMRMRMKKKERKEECERRAGGDDENRYAFHV